MVRVVSNVEEKHLAKMRILYDTAISRAESAEAALRDSPPTPEALRAAYTKTDALNEKIREALHALVEALPKCGLCDRYATHRLYEGYYCEEDAGLYKLSRPLDYALQVRAALALLAGMP